MNRNRVVGALVACCILFIAVTCGPFLILNNENNSQTICPLNESLLIPPIVNEIKTGGELDEYQIVLSLNNCSVQMENTTARIFKGPYSIHIEKGDLIRQLNKEDTKHFLRIMSICMHWNRCSLENKERCFSIGSSDLKVCQDKDGVLTGIVHKKYPLLSKQFTIALYVWAQVIFQ